jgi:D-alanyl-D-alanine carboxypeptidase
MQQRLHLLAPALFGVIGATSTLQAGTVAETVDQVLADTEVPGVAVGSFRDGKIETGFGGLRAIGQEDAVGAGDLWHVGSDTKAMTATLVARLVEADVIEWTDTVGGVLGDAIPDIDPAYRDVTYIELLSHRSGLPANIGRFASLGLAGFLANRDILADRIAYATDVLADPPADAADGFLYSNAGYVVVGAMLEAETGKAWEILLQTHVAAPLGMTDVGFGAPGRPGITDQPRGHARGLLGGISAVEPGSPGSDNIPALGPAGTLHLSVADMMRFLRAHATRDPGFLSPESWETLQTPAPGADYALGWGLDGDCLGHSGSNTMWYAQMVICPDRQEAAFVATNLGEVDVLEAPIRSAVAKLLAD